MLLMVIPRLSLWCVLKGMSVCLGAVFEPLTFALRAVEVFIRDKYERKRFYQQEAPAAAPVSTGVFICLLLPALRAFLRLR